MLGKSQGTDYYLLSEWAGGCVRACVRLCACACRVGRGGLRMGEYRPLLEPIRTQNCKIPPVHELENKRESNGQLLSGWIACVAGGLRFFFSLPSKSQNASNAGYRLREDPYGEIFRPWTWKYCPLVEMYLIRTYQSVKNTLIFPLTCHFQSRDITSRNKVIVFEKSIKEKKKIHLRWKT